MLTGQSVLCFVPLQEDHRDAIFVFNSRQGKLLSTINTDSSPIAVEQIVSKNGVSLITSGADMTLSTFSLDDPNPKRRFKAISSWATPAVQMSLAYSPDNRLLYSGATNGNIYSWNVDERNLVTTLTGHTDIVMSLIHLEKLNNIASASLDKTLSVWDSHTNEQILKLHGHKKGVFDLTYSANYRLIVSCGFEHDACVWSPFVNSLVYRLKGHHASLVGCKFVENTPELITADTSGVFKLWDVRNFQCVQTFSANLSGQDTKDSSTLSCFFHTKLPSRSTQQKEDDSRIYAASKNLFSFDQARVVHEATTDYSNVIWASYSQKNSCIVTASERNVIVWDALIGSRTFTHVNICGEDITACCLDDRERKIILGDAAGHVGVYNLSSGALMKSAPDRDSVSPLTVVALRYYDEAKRLIAGYSDGRMILFDEQMQDDVPIIRSFEHYNMHPELLCLLFDPNNLTAITAGLSGDAVKVWNYHSGKCDMEMHVCNGEVGHVVCVISLLPYPVIVTSDSTGNVLLWGSSGTKWQGMRVAGFVNMIPATADLEAQNFNQDAPPRRALPPTERRRLDWAKTTTLVLDHDHDSVDVADRDNNSARSLSSAESGSTASSFSMANPPAFVKQQSLQRGGLLARGASNNFQAEMLELEKRMYSESLTAMKSTYEQSRSKWGNGSAAQAMAWIEVGDSEQKLLLCGDDLGALRCYNISDALSDLRVSELLSQEHTINTQKINGTCRRTKRTTHSALSPMLQEGVSCLLGKDKDAMCYLGVEFCWALQAHNDRIVSVAATKIGFITSSADKLVKIWNFNGIPIGLLLQSVPVGTRSRNWDVSVDVDEIIRAEQTQLNEIIASTTALSLQEGKPNIYEMDFSGMALGAESAAFARSVLRQRIEQSGRRLGLNLPSADRQQALSTTSFADLSTVIDEQSSIDIAASTSSGNKSLEDALKELKSTDSAVDYVQRTKQMSHLQRKRKSNKLQFIAEVFEEKSGVNLGLKAKIAAANQRRSGNMEGKSREATERDIDQELISLVGSSSQFHGMVPSMSGEGSVELLPHEVQIATNGPIAAGDFDGNDASVLSAASVESLDSGRLKGNAKVTHTKSESRHAAVGSKIASSIKLAHANGERTIAMYESCNKFHSFRALEDTIERNAVSPKPTADDIEVHSTIILLKAHLFLH
jgi:WD40 repeat protein